MQAAKCRCGALASDVVYFMDGSKMYVCPDRKCWPAYTDDIASVLLVEDDV